MMQEKSETMSPVKDIFEVTVCFYEEEAGIDFGDLNLDKTETDIFDIVGSASYIQVIST